MKKISSTDGRSRWVPPIKGATVSVLCAIAMCALTAGLIFMGCIHEKWIPQAAIPILAISAFLGVKCSRWMSRGDVGNNSYLTGVVFLLMLIILKTVTGGTFDRMIPRMLSIVSGTVLGCIGRDRKKRGKVTVKRIHNR